MSLNSLIEILTITSISGIRGKIGKDLGLKDFVKIGRSFAEYIGQGICAVGRDTRLSGDMAAKATISGLMGGGCTVVDFGVVSTPTIFREVGKNRYNGGLIITASHNPSDWNGTKLVTEGRGLHEEELERFLAIKNSPSSMVFRHGTLFSMESNYPSDVIKYVGIGSCEGLSVAIDVGGGTGALFIPSIFGKLGCKVQTLNASPGIFSRGMDPTRDELEELSDTTISSDADLGLAFDCDADRVVFMKSDGIKLPADYTLLIYLKHLADMGKMVDVVASMDTSSAVDEMVEKTGHRVLYAKVGEANVVKLMQDKGITVGGEGSSGGLIISNFNLCRDGVLASALITKVVKENGSLKKVIDGIPKYHQIREYVRCKSKDARIIVNTLVKQEDSIIEKKNGFKIKNKDRSWILIRPSGTEDILRLTVESKSEETTSKIMKHYRDRVSEIIKEVRQV
jgi:phosphomannomutase